MVWVIKPGDATSRYGPMVEFDFIDPETGARPLGHRKFDLYFERLKDGRRLPNKGDWPTECRLVKSRKKLPVVWEILQQFCGQQPFVDLVEEFEPGVHEWLPLKFRDRKSGVLHPEQFYMLNVCQRLQSVVLDHPSVRTSQYGDGPVHWSQISGDMPIVFHKHIVEGHHIWRDDGATSKIFASDAFVEALEKRVPKGWRKGFAGRGGRLDEV